MWDDPATCCATCTVVAEAFCSLLSSVGDIHLLQSLQVLWLRG